MIDTKDKILVRAVNWLGDAVMTLPALSVLREAYPLSHIALLVRETLAPLFEHDPRVDEVIVYSADHRSILGRLKLAASIRRKRFSKAILFQNAFDAALIAFLARIPERIGYDRDARGGLLTVRVPFHGEDRKIHHSNYYLDLLAAVGITGSHTDPWLPLSLQERELARQRLAGLRRPVLGINPGATYGSTKRWFPERFAEVANWHLRDHSGSVVIFGGSTEVSIAQEIDKWVPDNKLLLAGRTSLRELIALIAECDLLLTNDSGPMHIAYAVKTPLVALFGSTDPGLTGPIGEGNIVMKADVSCSPCFERVCKRGDMRCMLSLSSDDAYLALENIQPRRRAVFFDRDGTLCEDVNYLKKWEDFRVFPEVDSLGALKKKGFALIGVSNQSGIARGIVDESFVRDVNQRFIDIYGFDEFFYCPHMPAAACPCRKPKPGMLLQARLRHRIDLKGSFVVGDKNDDMLAARAVGAKAIFMRTGRRRGSADADFVVNDLKEAVQVVLSCEHN